VTQTVGYKNFSESFDFYSEWPKCLWMA